MVYLEDNQARSEYHQQIVRNPNPEYNSITKTQIIRFLQSMELKNLHHNHSLHQVDEQYLPQKYSLPQS